MNSLKTLISRWREGTFPEILDDWKWIFTYSFRFKWQILAYVLLGVASTSLGLASSVAGKYLIDIITGYRISDLPAAILILVGGSLLSLFFENIISRIAARLTIDIRNEIQGEVFARVMDADWMALGKYSNGDLLNRFNDDMQTVGSNAVSWLPTVILSLYRFCATFCVIFYYDKIMAFLALGSLPFLLLASRTMMRRQREYSKKVKETSSGLMAFEVEAFYHIDTVKAFDATDIYRKNLSRWQEKWRDIGMKYNLFTIQTNILLSLVGMVVQLASFGYCLFLLWNRTISFGTMSLFLQQKNSLTSAFNSLVSLVPSFLSSSVSAHRIRELASLPGELHQERDSGQKAGGSGEKAVVSGQEAGGSGQWLVDSGQETVDSGQKAVVSGQKAVVSGQVGGKGFRVRLEQVEFAYLEGKSVLQESSLVADSGEIVALVGPSGEGKTTVIRLLLGLVYPERGEVFLEAEGERVMVNADTRRYFAYVPQGNTILSGTIADNLRLTKADATEEEMMEALKAACAWEFVEKMPKGLYSSLGEKGRGLSEGQAQRIAIARALLRDAPVLLMDEATSALDVATERRVLRSLMESQPGRTCILTTHRPSVLSMCQRVYRVVDSRITELDEEEASHMAMDF